MLCYSIEMVAPNQIKRRRVLLVEDDNILRRNYETLLSSHHLTVQPCATKSDALAAFDGEMFDVVILDVTLGGEYEAGFDLCRTFREKEKFIPILFLTERDEDADRISGLRLGADAYLSKTISSTYLVARINALIRRVETLLSGAVEEASAASAKAGSLLTIDERLSRAYWLGSPLDLSLTQFWILKDAAKHARDVSSNTELMHAAQL